MSIDPNSVYYDAGGIETMEVIKAKLSDEQFTGFCLGNALKYLCRCNFKSESLHRDVEKALTYLCQITDKTAPGSGSRSADPERPNKAEYSFPGERQE